MLSMLDHALAYARHGWSVFPKVPGTKQPIGGVRGWLDASKDPNKIKEWWGKNPDASISVPCGEANGFVVLDIDPRHGGSKSLVELQQQHGKLPETVAVVTGGGGWHLYFKWSLGVRTSIGKIGDGIDIISYGYAIIMPPSLHASGKRYEFYNGRSPDDIAIADMPGWLLQRAIDANSNRASGSEAAPPDVYRELFQNGASSGKRNVAMVKMAGHLIRKKIDPLLAADILRLWNQERFKPPLSNEEFENCIDWVAGKEVERIIKRRGGKQ